ncbi:MAG: HAD-IA family hydrolase [Clostridia bacterium]|nr:HAD-IA family hydrolase [Clostridia bacterium]
MKYESFIFDLDGTLLDTLDDLTAAVNHALAWGRYALRTREEVREFIGNGVVKLMERAMGKCKEDAPDFQEVFATFKEYYGAHCEENTRPYAGILEVLQAIKAAGKSCAIVSNKADFAVKKLARSYFAELVDVAIGENEEAGVKKKPAPDSVLAAMRALGVRKEGAVYVGDSEVDLETARNAGLPCISVAWGMKTEEFLLAHGASVVLHDPVELKKYV